LEVAFLLCLPCRILFLIYVSCSLASAARTTTVHLSSPDAESTHARAFLEARRALDHVLPLVTPDLTRPQKAAGCTTDAVVAHMEEEEDLDSVRRRLLIPSDADSAHATGFHGLGGMSRYNALREGIVFSDGKVIRDKDMDGIFDKSKEGMISMMNGGSSDHDDRVLASGNPPHVGQFEESMLAMSESLHGIADRVLTALEEELQLSPGYFQRHLGPFRTSSQWHMKRFVDPGRPVPSKGPGPPGSSSDVATNDDPPCPPSTVRVLAGATDETILLPMHTDPSLISVVIHDSPGTNPVGAMGLQYLETSTGRWIDVHGHGHNVATVFVGSVLAHLTAGHWPAVKHRVVAVEGPRTGCSSPDLETGDVRTERPRRMAATLFVRPQPKAVLHVPLPSPSLLGKTKAKPDMTFETWVKRVAKNYERKREGNKKR
jgi:hypothetical protein